MFALADFAATTRPTPRALALWESYVGRGAPSNAAGNRHGYGRTREEASQHAGHHANQLPWERHRRVWLSDHPSQEALCWAVLGGDLANPPLPLSPEGERIVRLAQAGHHVLAVEAYHAACDAGTNLYLP